MKRDKNHIMEEWVCPKAFPFILPLVDKLSNGHISLKTAYNEIDSFSEKFGFMKTALYEKLNLAYFLKHFKFLEGIKTIPHEAQQGKNFKGGLCLSSQPSGYNTIVFINNTFELKRVW